MCTFTARDIVGNGSWTWRNALADVTAKWQKACQLAWKGREGKGREGKEREGISKRLFMAVAYVLFSSIVQCLVSSLS